MEGAAPRREGRAEVERARELGSCASSADKNRQSVQSPSRWAKCDRARSCSTCAGVSATMSCPGRSSSASIPRSARKRSSSSRFSRPSRASSRASASPKWRRRELVRVVDRLPDDPGVAARGRRSPTSPCSRTATESAGSSSFRKSAVQRPVKPPPTIATSARRRRRGLAPRARPRRREPVAGRPRSADGTRRPRPRAGRLAVDLLERLLERRQEPVELRVGIDQRRLDAQHLRVDVGARDQDAARRRGPWRPRSRGRGSTNSMPSIRPRPRAPCHDLRVLLRERVHPRQQVLALLPRLLRQVFLDQDVDRRDRRGAADRVAAEGRRVQERVVDVPLPGLRRARRTRRSA